MDKMIGLEFDAKNSLDQNYRVKYTAVADSRVNAGAYYNGDFIAVCSNSIAPIFQYGWGTLHLTINIDDFNVIKNKDLQLMQNGELIKKIKISSKNILIENLNTGTYEIRLPIDYDYENKLCVVNLVEGDNEITYDYIKIDKTKKLPLTAIKIKGIYGTVGYILTFSDNYKVGKITLGGSDLGNRNTTWANKPDDVYVSVTIKNEKDEEVDKIEVKGNHYFTDYTLTNPTINFETNWTITIYTQRPNLVGVYSLETGNKINAYNCSNNTITYQVTEKGLKLVGDDNFDENKCCMKKKKTKQ